MVGVPREPEVHVLVVVGRLDLQFEEQVFGFRLDRPYATDIDDVYQRPSTPSWVGFLFAPARTPSRPASLAELERALADEHDAAARFFADKPERLLGAISVWDPAIGRMNLIQALRVAVHHDRHHYTAVRRMLGR